MLFTFTLFALYVLNGNGHEVFNENDKQSIIGQRSTSRPIGVEHVSVHKQHHSDRSEPQQKNEYLFYYNTTIQDKFFKIKGIQPINNQTILIDAQPTESDNTTTVNIYGGNNFETKVSQKNISSNQSIKISQQKLYVNKKDRIEESFMKTINFSVVVSDSYNRNDFIKDGYFYYDRDGKYWQYKTLWRVNLDTRIEELIDYRGNITERSRFYYGYSMTDVGGGFIGYLKHIETDDYILYIINTKTIKIQYELVVGFSHPNQDYIEYYHDQKTNQSKIVVFDRYYAPNLQTFLFNHSTQKYEAVSYLSTINYYCHSFLLTGFDEGTCYNSKILTHINKTSFNILYLSSDTLNDQMFIGRNFTLASSNQSLLLMLYQQESKLQLYSVDQKTNDYATKKIYSIDILGNYVSSQLTSDDKKLFVFSSSQSKNRLIIYTFYDMQLIAQIDEDPLRTHLAFAIFDTLYDRYVVMIKRVNSSVNGVTETHHLQIRQISKPSNLIQEFPLTFLDGKPSFGYKIKTDNSSKLIFMILVKSYNDTVNNADKSRVYICSIKNDNFSQITNGSEQFSYQFTYFGSRYIFTLPSYQQNQTTIRIHDKQNLTLLKKIISFRSNILFFKDDTLLISSSTYDGFGIDRYELNDSIDSSNFGKMTRIYTNFYQYQQILILLKKKELIISYDFTKETYSNQVLKAVFNASLPIDKIIQIPNISTVRTNYKDNAYIAKNKNPYLKCDTYIFVQDGNIEQNINYFRSFETCEPSEPPRKHSLLKQGDSENITSFSLYKASTNHHIITKFTIQEKKIQRIQLRSVNRDYEILWEKQFPTNDQDFQEVNAVDFTNDGIFIFKRKYRQNYSYAAFLITPQIDNLAKIYEIKSFIMFDANDLGSIAFIGESVLSTPQKPMFYVTAIDRNKGTLFHRNFSPNNKNAITPQMFKGITIDELNSKVAIGYQTTLEKITFLAWGFVFPDDPILDIQVTGKQLNKIQFVGPEKLLFDVDGQFTIVSLDIRKTQRFSTVLKDFPQSQLRAISKDGNLLAFLSDKNLSIYDQNQTIISEIKLQIDSTQIQAMSFGIDKSLFLIDNNSTVTVFTNQFNCSHGYTYQKGYCICLREYADPQNCQCQRNFVDQENGTCACLEPLILNGSNCQCDKNFVDQVNGTCACLWPFALNGSNCQCDKNFVYQDNGACACLWPFALNGSNCQCDKNFVYQDNGACACLRPFALIGTDCSQCLEGEYVFVRSCQKCSFWCKECEGSSLSCTKYSVEFYVIVIGGSFLLIGMIGVGVWLIKMWKARISNESVEDSKEKGENTQKSASDLLAEDTLSKALRSERSE